MAKIKYFTVSIIGIFLLLSCEKNDLPADVLYQVNSFSIFAEGHYEGFYSYADIVRQGDFGIGTFDGLNGEMVLLDGVIYRVQPQGDPLVVGKDETAPLATYCQFSADMEFQVTDLNLSELKAYIDERLPSPDLFYAIRIEGDFDSLLTRSVYKQEEPYRVLSEVIKEEVRKESVDVAGTIVGFKVPVYSEQTLWKDYHLHFISDDRELGGHLHEAKLKSGIIKIDILNRFHLILKD